MIQINKEQLVSVSDDCTIKFWNATGMKVEEKINTETITCVAVSGQNKEMLIAGCHSGNLMIVNCSKTEKRETIENAHENLLRVVCSLSELKNRYFLSADVCGYVRAWSTVVNNLRPEFVCEIELSDAISYNSMIEVASFLPDDSVYTDAATVVAVALKNCEIKLIIFVPGQQ